MIKAIIRPYIIRKLEKIDEERDWVALAIERARKGKRAVQPLYKRAQVLQQKAAKLERWL